MSALLLLLIMALQFTPASSASSSSSSSPAVLLRRKLPLTNATGVAAAGAPLRAEDRDETIDEAERQHAELRLYAGELRRRLLQSLRTSDPDRLRGFLWDDYAVGGISRADLSKIKKGTMGGKMSGTTAAGQIQGVNGLNGDKWWCDAPQVSGKGGGGGGKASSKGGGGMMGGKGSKGGMSKGKGGGGSSSKSMKGKGGGKGGGSKGKGGGSKGKKGSKGKGKGKGGKKERAFQRYFNWD
jgi:hypothetical protein